MTMLRVVRGTPDDEELAAVVAALAIVSARRTARSRNTTSRRFAISEWRTAIGGDGTPGKAGPRAGGWRALGRTQR